MVIDDVVVRQGSSHVELDIRVRNPENYVVNITRADLNVIERMPYAAMYKESASYDLLLEGEHNSIPVAHVLQSNEVDRFIIKVGFTSYNTSCGFRARLILNYNKDQTATSEPFTFESVFD
jgi:hypothetical protein